MTPDELIRRVEDWIEGEMQRIGTKSSQQSAASSQR